MAEKVHPTLFSAAARAARKTGFTAAALKGSGEQTITPCLRKSRLWPTPQLAKRANVAVSSCRQKFLWSRGISVLLASAVLVSGSLAEAHARSQAQGTAPEAERAQGAQRQATPTKIRPQKTAQSSSTLARTSLKPRLAPGDVIRYRVELQTTSQTTTHTGAVADPQGPSQLVVTWDAIVRLEVLGVPASGTDPHASGQAPSGQAPAGAVSARSPARASSSKSPEPAPAATQAMLIRTVYEKSAATVKSDTPDPAAEGIEKQYGQLEGHSIEFTLGADGHISDVHGLEGVVSDDKAKNAAEQWLAQISGSSSALAGGIVAGQNWTSEETAASLPLAGLVWRTGSSYLRNESCQAANPAGSAGAPEQVAAAGENCALILSRLTLVTPRVLRDPTPAEFRRNGLHSSGHWTGSGESLSYVSLKNGWVVSVTQSGTEEMDVTIANATDGVSVRYAGTIRTRSDLSLLPPEAGTPASPAEPAKMSVPSPPASPN